MLLESLLQFERIMGNLDSWALPERFEKKEVLMVEPRYFSVEYAINDFMKDKDGNLNQVDRDRAGRQWCDVKDAFEQIQLRVHSLDPDPAFPDLVFCANQSFPFLSGSGERNVVISSMRHPARRGEERILELWYRANGYRVHSLRADTFFEGMGDAILDRRHRLIWGGVSARTGKNAYEELSAVTGFPVVPLIIQNETFYHLDTCFALLGPDAAAIQADCFTGEALAILKRRFPVLLEVDPSENRRYFACNCFSPDGRHVVLQKGSEDFLKALKGAGFTPVEVDTSEFMKSGGSVFCMKMELP